MKHLLIPFALGIALSLTNAAAAADCYADYKAKRGNPLRLHYGVMQLHDGCGVGGANTEVSTRLSQNGWTLLNVMSIFGSEGLQERKADAGAFFLRF